MANYEDTLVKQVTVNVLTKEQYNNLTEKDVNQFYLTTDEEESYTQSESDSKYATKSELSEGLGAKQDKGDYATNNALADGLNTKVNIDQGIDNKDKILVVNSDGKLSISNNKLNNYATNTSLNDHKNNTSNPHSVTKTQVGLGNVDNTSDLNKPISTATQTALDLKADKSTTYTKTEIDSTKANKAVPTATGNVAKLNADGDLIDGGALGKLATKDTISSNDISDNAIISSKIKDSAVGSSKIIDGAITDAKIAENAAISISKIDTLQESLDSKLDIDQGVENYRKIVSVGKEGLLELTDNEGISVDGIGLLFEEKMFPIPIDDVRLVPLNNPGQTTGALYEGFKDKFPDAWNILVEAKAKAIAGEPGYERYNKTQVEYDAELLRTTIYDTDGSTVLKMGFCGFFVINDDGSVRFPFKGDAFDRGQVDGINVDTLDQIRNITGELSNNGWILSQNADTTIGCVTTGGSISVYYGGTTGTGVDKFYIDASNVVPTGIENQPRAQGKFYYLVLGNAVEAVSEVKIRQSIDAYVNDTTLPYIAEEGNKWVDSIRNYMGTFISSARNNIPYGALRCDGLSYSDELGLEYNDTNFPDLYDALIKGNLKSVGIDVFDSLVADNGWCGVFGLQEEKDIPSTGYYAWINGDHILYTTTDQISEGITVYNADLSVLRNDAFSYIAMNDQGGLFLHHEKEGFAMYYRNMINDIAGEPVHVSAYFKTPKITNASQQNVIPLEDGSNKHLGRVLIKSQKPTEENNYIWYNLYDDGWVEQGGGMDIWGTAQATNVTITYTIPMKNDANMINVTFPGTTSTTAYDTTGVKSQTSTGFISTGLSSSKSANNSFVWEVHGYVSNEIIENLIQSNDNFFIQCYNTNKEVSIADFEQALDVYTDDVIIPEINDIALNWVNDITYKMGSLIQSNKTEAPKGLIKLDGLNTDSLITYNKTNFPDLYNALVNGIINSVTIDEFNNLISNNGWCGVCGLDIINEEFYAPKITNSNQFGIIPLEDGSNKHLGRVLIKSQEPTEENNYTWYNLYNDGWVEQGGQKSAPKGASEISFPIPMHDDQYTVSVNALVDSSDARIVQVQSGKTAEHLNIMTNNAFTVYWVMYGYSNQIPEYSPIYYMVAYSDATDISIGDYASMLDEYTDNTLKPELTLFADNEIDRINDVSNNWIKDITYKMGNLVQSSRTDIPRGLIKTDGLDNNGEISYTPENYPDLYDALLNNKIKSVDIDTYDKLIATDGWCGVFGLQRDEDTYKTYYGWRLGDSILYTEIVDVKYGVAVYDTDLNILYNDEMPYINIDSNDNLYLYHDLDKFPIHYRDETLDKKIIAGHRYSLFKSPKITNVHQYGVVPLEDGSNKHLGRVLVKSQEPTEENNYTWYNLYNDGWVEQGGLNASSGTPSGYITLIIPMSSTNYWVMGQWCGTSATDTGTARSNYNYAAPYSTTQILVGCYDTTNPCAWRVCGYSNQIPEQLPTYYVVAYNDSTEVSIADYNSMLTEYSDDTIKPDLLNYADSLKPDLEIYREDTQRYAQEVKEIIHHLPLLFETVSSHTLNEITWLRANTFSWQYQRMYPAIYQHLLNDLTSATEERRYVSSNVNIVGQLGDINGVLSGFTTNTSYANIPAKTPTNSFELVVKCHTSATSGAYSFIESPASYVGVVIRWQADKTLRCWSSSNGSSWNIMSNYNPGLSIPADSDVWIKLTWDGSNYIVSVSLDNIIWTDGTPVASTLPINWSTGLQGLGGASWETAPFTDGSIDLNDSYLDIDNERYWTGCNYLTYYKAKDNHYICKASELENIIYLYEKYNMANYFIIDEDNARFKLPRKTYRNLVKSTKDEYGCWYNLYDDGWVEQGGKIEFFSTSGYQNAREIALRVRMANIDYFAIISDGWNERVSDGQAIIARTQRTFKIGKFTSRANDIPATWTVQGYAHESELKDIPLNLEYYYAGNFSEDSLEQMAGVTADVLEQKADASNFVLVDELPESPNPEVFYFIPE